MRSRRLQTGFSLIELMCAVAILTIGVIGLTEALITSLRSARDAEQHVAAGWYAAGLVEFARAEGYLRAGVTEGDCAPALPGHRWRQTLSPGNLDGLFEVTVAILSDRTGRPVFELQTRLFEAPSGGLFQTDPERRPREGIR